MRCHIYLFLILLGFTCRLSAQTDSTLNLQQRLPSDDTWWAMFGDTTLIRLIRVSMDNNYNLLNAIKNIDLARARWRIQQSGFYPSLSASAEYSPEKSSLGIDRINDYSRVGQVGVEMNWEIDVIGSIRKRVRAEKENYLASQEDYRGVMVSLAAEVAAAYIRLRMYQQQLVVARDNVRSQQEVLRINEAKLQAGLASRLSVAQARGLLLQTQALIPGIEASVYNEVNTLAVLTGSYSDALRRELLALRPMPAGTGKLVIGIPAELIRRRPDLRSAERQMDALAALVGATRADWWPKFYLTAAFGYGSKYFKDLFKKENMTWQIAPAVKWTIFSGRQLVENTRMAQIQLEEGINNFNQTMLTALSEVDNALMTYNKSLQQLSANRDALAQIRQTLTYAIELYRQGLVDYQNVLDSQRNVFTYENTLVSSQSSMLLALIQVYKALGGGWESWESAAP